MGTWIELDEGIFLKSSGKTSLTYSNSAKDGGNNSITLGENNIPPVTIRQRVSSNNVIAVGYGVGNREYGIQLPTYEGVNKLQYLAYTRTGDTSDLTTPFDNRPEYKNCHIWYRQS